MSRLAYLARPLDFNADEGDLFRAFDAIKRAGYVVYDPGSAFTMTSLSAPDAKTSAGINAVNEAALLAADLLVALWAPGVRSVGVPAEIALAMSWGMNVLLVVPGDGTWPGVVMTGWGHTLAEEKRGGFTDLAGLYAEIRLLDAPAQ